MPSIPRAGGFGKVSVWAGVMLKICVSHAWCMRLGRSVNVIWNRWYSQTWAWMAMCLGSFAHWCKLSSSLVALQWFCTLSMGGHFLRATLHIKYYHTPWLYNLLPRQHNCRREISTYVAQGNRLCNKMFTSSEQHHVYLQCLKFFLTCFLYTQRWTQHSNIHVHCSSALSLIQK